MLHVHYVYGDDVVDSRIRLYEAGDLAADGRSGRLPRRRALRRLRRRIRSGREDSARARWRSAHERRAAPTPPVVVDAYSTGARLAPRFAAAGLDVVHVQSSPRLPDFYAARLRAGDFVENVVHEGDLEATAARVAAHDPAFVVVGAEPGVLLTDALSERLGLPCNGSALSAARRDKHAMARGAAQRRPARGRGAEDRRRRARRSRGRRRAAAGRSSSSRSTAPAPTGSASAQTPAAIQRRLRRERSAGPTPCTAPTRSCSSRSCCAARSSSSTRSAGTASTTSPRSGATTSCRVGANFVYDFEELLAAPRRAAGPGRPVRRQRCSTRSASASARRTPR